MPAKPKPVRHSMNAPVGPRLLVATFNRGKLEEMKLSLAKAPVELVSLEAVPGVTTAPEEGTTFEANARQKAVHYSRYTELPTLADDSGLLVDALGGRPGVYSARYLSEQASDAERCRRILEELDPVEDDRRTARFECWIALAQQGEVLEVFRGTLRGVIGRDLRGDNGFGYDPIFQVPERGCSLAELSPGEKLRISHRGRALRKLQQALFGA
ncbi:MAG: RdgB/HAM1 family non-canonical purine NTP pyrophosphatase [Acidobacteria bacterium]|nr:RdgB/HAM1 family non-canonical purine NTP pyrophosphatase [Acidobacteriota bacterium]